ncbi:MAG: Ser-Thr-rich GPI-anchored membrane family protein [Candidatus Saccharicenans sp.]
MKKCVFLLSVLLLGSSVFSATLTILVPNGNENWQISTTQNIKWKAQGLSGNVQLILIKDSTEVGIIAQNVPASAGSFPWVVGSCTKMGRKTMAEPGTGYKVRIVSSSGHIQDVSDLPFKITGVQAQSKPQTMQQTKQINLIAPNGGEKWIKGETKTINWSAFGVQEGYVIALVKGARELGLIADNLSQGQMTYNWKVGDSLIGGLRYELGDDYKVIVRSKSGDVSDISDRPFSISEISPQVGTAKVTGSVVPEGSIRVLSPNGGETFYTGEYMTVRYETKGAIQKVSFWLSEKRPDGTYFDHRYEGPFSPTGQYMFKVPDIVHPSYPDKHYVIRMYGTILEKKVNLYDESDNVFFIKRGFDLVPKIDSLEIQIKRGNAWSLVDNVLTVGLYELLVGSDITGIKIKMKFTIKNTGHQWPTLPISILCKGSVESAYPNPAGQILGRNTGYASLTEYGGVAKGEIEIEIPSSYRGNLITRLEIDPDHIFEKDYFWSNNKDSYSWLIKE